MEWDDGGGSEIVPNVPTSRLPFSSLRGGLFLCYWCSGEAYIYVHACSPAYHLQPAMTACHGGWHSVHAPKRW
jgi:hypothetical protein